jgi:hypothetical protein
MLMNNLDPDVAERPEDLVVYGGSGKAARNWPAFDAIVRSLRSLEHDETLLVQSGKPVGIFQTHPGAPRVLIANSLLVPAWANWDTFRDLEDRGLTMFGQMTAGSWIYIGSQGIVQGTYETLSAVARRHFGGSVNINCVSPETSAVTAGPAPPLYGMWVISMPAVLRNTSISRRFPLALPGDPKLSLPGSFLARTMSSRTVFTGREGWTTSALGTSTICVIAARSRVGRTVDVV